MSAIATIIESPVFSKLLGVVADIAENNPGELKAAVNGLADSPLKTLLESANADDLSLFFKDAKAAYQTTQKANGIGKKCLQMWRDSTKLQADLQQMANDEANSPYNESNHPLYSYDQSA